MVIFVQFFGQFFRQFWGWFLRWFWVNFWEPEKCQNLIASSNLKLSCFSWRRKSHLSLLWQMVTMRARWKRSCSTPTMELLSRKTKQEKNDLPERVIWLSDLEFHFSQKKSILVVWIWVWNDFHVLGYTVKKIVLDPNNEIVVTKEKTRKNNLSKRAIWLSTLRSLLSVLFY